MSDGKLTPLDGLPVGAAVDAGGGTIVNVAGYDPVEHNLFGLDILSQDVWWKPATGERVLLVEMEPSHRRNLLRWLERNARALELQDSLLYLSGPFTAGGDMAQMAEEEWLDQKGEDPWGWMRGTKLYRRLAELVAADEAAADPMAKGWWEA